MCVCVAHIQYEAVASCGYCPYLPTAASHVTSPILLPAFVNVQQRSHNREHTRKHTREHTQEDTREHTLRMLNTNCLELHSKAEEWTRVFWLEHRAASLEFWYIFAFQWDILLYFVLTNICGCELDMDL